MSIEEEIKKSIDEQFKKNEHKNLFYQELDYRKQFLEETKELLLKYGDELYSIDSSQGSGKWVDLMTEKAIRTFLNANQFMDIREQQIKELHLIYQLLWKDLLNEIREQPVNFDELQKKHLIRLTAWLEKSNAFTKQINKSDQPEIIKVICAEYSSILQLQLLRIDVSVLQQPVLDIGCGEHNYLVTFLRETGIEAVGLDRLTEPSDNMIQANWLEYPFKPAQWGSIISNHSFTLHFLNHHLRADGDYIAYAEKYKEILNSLIPGGTFYYTPNLPFIESYLSPDEYNVLNYRINDSFSCTHVKRNI
jgi:hypothetical protein